MEAPPAKGLTEHLGAWPKGRTASAIIAASILLVAADFAFPGIGSGPLYIPLICLTGWALGFRASCIMVAGAIVLAMIPAWIQEVQVEGEILAAKAATRLVGYGFVAGIVRSFRRAYDRERFMARRDIMTGALNKATFEQHAAKLLRAAAIVDRTLLLATIDLDDFKKLNDTYGHAAGDAVLHAFAANVAAVLRREDCLGRIGGDEFALLVPVEDSADGRIMAERLHQRLSGVLRELPYPMTFSMGALVVGSTAGLNWTVLMHRADQLMYHVKRTGKGAVMIDAIGGSAPRVGERRAQLHAVRIGTAA